MRKTDIRMASLSRICNKGIKKIKCMALFWVAKINDLNSIFFFFLKSMFVNYCRTKYFHLVLVKSLESWS